MANRYLQEDHVGQSLALVPVKVELPARGDEPATVKIRFSVWLTHEEVPSADRPPDLYVGRDTNPGLLAGDLVKLLRPAFRESVSIGGMGPIATSRAVKAL